MKKVILNLVVLGLGFDAIVAAIMMTEPTVRLRPTIDPAIHAEYIAPDTHFIGVTPPIKNGKAHTASLGKSQSMRASAVRKKVMAQGSASHAGEVLFGQFSTAKAMGYHAGPVEYHRRMLTCPLVKEYVK
jgi:hypothetical protein